MSGQGTHDEEMICQEDAGEITVQPAKSFVRQFYSTTSSVYLQHTIRNPCSEQILFW